MARTIVLLSGRVRSGKSTLAAQLQGLFGADLFSSRELIVSRAPDASENRGAQQTTGSRLDRDEGADWLALPFARWVTGLPANALVVLDAVRTRDQVEAIRRSFTDRIVHLHLQAPYETLADRYADLSKGSASSSGESYERVSSDPTEAGVDELGNYADAVLDTSLCTPDDLAVMAGSRLGLFGRETGAIVDVLVGGQYGSEGKGNIASAIANEYDLLVRVGGPNAGHRVRWTDDRTFTHHHLPSGAGLSEALLLLGPGAVVCPQALMKEIADARIDVERLVIDENATVITAEDRAAEKDLVDAIASTGQGVGNARVQRILDRAWGGNLAKHVPELKPYLGSAHEILDQAFASGRRILLEGTQGTGLSLYHGSYPYVTSCDTTVSGVLSGAGIPPGRVRKTIMVCRTFPIRVGDPDDRTSGPLPNELDWEDVSKISGISLSELRETERTSTTNRPRRVGRFSWHQLRRAAQLNAPTDIALTFADYLDVRNREAYRLDQLQPATIRFIEEVEAVANAPVTLVSCRFDRRVIDQRTWAAPNRRSAPWRPARRTRATTAKLVSV
jgi:adenylosuccinate synthase